MSKAPQALKVVKVLKVLKVQEVLKVQKVVPDLRHIAKEAVPENGLAHRHRVPANGVQTRMFAGRMPNL